MAKKAEVDPLTKKVARYLSESRGANPDEPVTIGKPDGTFEKFDPAWEGYVELAGEIIEIVKNA